MEEAAGDAAPDLMPCISAILGEREGEKSFFWQEETVAEMGHRVTDWLRTNHAELSGDAISAVADLIIT